MIAELAEGHVLGEAAPNVEYTAEEEATWVEIWSHLRPAHERFACQEVRESMNRWAPWERQIPQLADLSLAGGPLERTGITFEPVPGLVPSRSFFSSLAVGIFQSTQYLRHPSRPLYTPEPDLVHELVGHAGTFSIPGVADLSRAFGAAAENASAGSLVLLERLYWFTAEFGLVLEHGQPKAFGAGLLSSASELEGVQAACVRPFSIDEITATPYGTSDIQPVLFAAESMDQLISETLAACRRTG